MSIRGSYRHDPKAGKVGFSQPDRIKAEFFGVLNLFNGLLVNPPLVDRFCLGPGGGDVEEARGPSAGLTNLLCKWFEVLTSVVSADTGAQLLCC